MVFNLHLEDTTQVEAIIAEITDFHRDNLSNILLTLTQLDNETGETDAERVDLFSINTYGIGNRTNYSVGEAFGAVTMCYQDNEGYFDLEELVGQKIVCFVHQKKSRDGSQTYSNLVDVFPLSELQFSWLNEGEEE